MTHIVVVGAGVVGLSCALRISEKLHPQNDTKVTVVAHYLPTDSLDNPEYTSAWAGAHFRPFPSKNDAEEHEWPLTRITQEYAKRLSVASPEAGIEFKTGIDYVGGEAAKLYHELPKSYTEAMEDFEVLQDETLAQKEVSFAAKYKQWVVNPPVYLNFLFNQLRVKCGVDFIKRKLDSLSDVKEFLPDVDIIINCSGMGLQYRGGYDKLCFPIRGQTLLVRPPMPFTFDTNPYFNTGITHQLASGNWTFCITRPQYGGVIVGGTKQPHDTYAKPREEDTRELVSRALKLFPELMHTDKKTGQKYFDILQINVGFRPARRGGLRLDLESIPHCKTKVIHAYGAAGSGYELSYGIATKVEELLQTVLCRSKL